MHLNIHVHTFIIHHAHAYAPFHIRTEFTKVHTLTLSHLHALTQTHAKFMCANPDKPPNPLTLMYS